MRALVILLSVLLMTLPAAPAVAVSPDEVLADPRLELRARALSSELRCLVCQNQSIDDSDAPLARDLRLLVRERLKAGDSDGDVMAYIVARYGEFVLLRPPLGWHTLALWLAPALILLGSIAVIARRMRRVQPTSLAAANALTSEEEAHLAALLAEQPPAGEPSRDASPGRRSPMPPG